MDTTRLSKVARLFQKELGVYFQQNAREMFNGLMLSVTVVRISPDLSYAKVYVSVFPSEKAEDAIKQLKSAKREIRHVMAQNMRHQLRKMPELEFFVDDSLDYAEHIDNLLKQ